MLRVLFAGDAANARAIASAGTVTVYQPSVASWYYDAGLQTGCGFNARYGVANKSLPCGTKVQFRYGDRTVMATVDDRGPYVGRTHLGPRSEHSRRAGLRSRRGHRLGERPLGPRRAHRAHPALA